MKLTADLQNRKLAIGEAVFAISNNIRTLREGTRKSSEVARTIPDNLPYDPQPFPKGKWKITGLDWQKAKGFDPRTYGPVKIRTDARQWVKVWELDADGDYSRERGDEVMDHGYLLHYSQSNTTLGCIRLASPQDAEAIANLAQAAFDRKEPVELEVI